MISLARLGPKHQPRLMVAAPSAPSASSGASTVLVVVLRYWLPLLNTIILYTPVFLTEVAAITMIYDASCLSTSFLLHYDTTTSY